MKYPIRQCIPSPGWKAFICSLGKDDQPTFTEEPLLCFALDDEGVICPLVFEDSEVIDFTEEDRACKTSAGRVLGPGQTLTDDIKKQLENRARNKLKAARK